jgi:hypothetical protein
MSGARVEHTINDAAIRKVAERAKRKYVHAWQAIHDDVWRTHAGQPKEKVRAAIKRHPTTRKLEPSNDMINRVAEAIANRKRITFG